MNYDFELVIDDLVLNSRITGLVGNNGAGKTTLISLLCFLRKLDYGSIYFNKINVNNNNLDWWKAQLGVFIEDSFIFDYYSTIEYLEFIISAYNVNSPSVISKMNDYIKLLGLEEYINYRVSNLSFGNKKKLGLLASLVVNPKIVLWDEPFSGLDPKSQEALKQIITQYSEEENSITLISSHDLHHVIEISSKIFIMNKGKISLDVSDNISYQELKKNLLE
jgi:ABC-2 type transport system ATP-binding protein